MDIRVKPGPDGSRGGAAEISVSRRMPRMKSARCISPPSLRRARAGEIFYATAGRGTATHLASELFNMMAGTKLVPVHYRGGGDTIKDLLSGQDKVMFSSIAPVLACVKDGRLRGIATSGPTRDAALPELPTVAESGLSGFDMRLWIGLLAPA